MERAVILASGYTLSGDDFMLKPVSPRKLKPENLNLEEMEQTAIEKALEQAAGNLNKAAELLGISRFTLYRKMEKLSK